MPRTASIHRQTRETDVRLEVDLDGEGCSQLATGVGFLDHMLELFAKHSCCDLTVEAQGDLQVDQHHTVEDIGICLGQAVRDALGDKTGIRRYGSMTLPMDETLVTAAVDLGGRYAFEWRLAIPTEKIGQFDSELVMTGFRLGEASDPGVKRDLGVVGSDAADDSVWLIVTGVAASNTNVPGLILKLERLGLFKRVVMTSNQREAFAGGQRTGFTIACRVQ